jgi:MFS family permease
MASEETTPLLSTTPGHERLDDVYLRFSSTKKNIILAMVSGCGVINYSMIGTFTPSIPQIAKDLNSTGAVVNIAVSISVLAASFGALTTASYSTFYGRRPAYLCALPVLVIGSIGVATAPNIYSLLFWRVFQSMGASPGPALGAAVIGDIFKLEERGRAMGVFFATCLVGTTLSPFAAGWVIHCFSWRVVQSILGLVGLIAFTTIYFLFPETAQPGERGIDIMKANGTPRSSGGFVFINPLQSLGLLRSPIMLFISIIVFASMVSAFALTVPLPYTIVRVFAIT